MSWFKQTKRSFVESVCINVLKCGPIPRHVAFIMDGNRRYARKSAVSTIDGHKQGFERMTQMLEWCLDLGVDEVTVYAFAIDNFKRSDEEVNNLMDFANELFHKLLQDKDNLNETGKAIRFFGDLTLLRPDIQQLVAEVELSTQNNTQKVLNIAISYSSRHEITNALQELQTCVQNDIIKESDITESLISQFLYSNHSSEPDLLIRTSGEVRLSDFLLWQTNYSVIAFANVLWPEFTIWDLFSAIIYYQRNCSFSETAKHKHQLRLKSIEDKQTQEEWMASDDIDLDLFIANKRERLTKCLQYLENKRLNQLKSLAKSTLITTKT
ncbi:dehydrodolichyl diphosphate synthase complex subunit DHDDS-like [Oppia nitens]|uniref:dehydrodolichyl diphosphate synthase complex subunit DHDDS-like n=1 Tax=Oppia nitens TaxID=1686743 RepID=UPI0023DC084E|nr:dehydrodolichyl diphosphate synthase complex subunit DHDDS-like [Oppia nitens]